MSFLLIDIRLEIKEFPSFLTTKIKKRWLLVDTMQQQQEQKRRNEGGGIKKNENKGGEGKEKKEKRIKETLFERKKEYSRYSFLVGSAGRSWAIHPTSGVSIENSPAAHTHTDTHRGSKATFGAFDAAKDDPVIPSFYRFGSSFHSLLALFFLLLFFWPYPFL